MMRWKSPWSSISTKSTKLLLDYNASIIEDVAAKFWNMCFWHIFYQHRLFLSHSDFNIAPRATKFWSVHLWFQENGEKLKNFCQGLAETSLLQERARETDMSALDITELSDNKRIWSRCQDISFAVDCDIYIKLTSRNWPEDIILHTRLKQRPWMCICTDLPGLHLRHQVQNLQRKTGGFALDSEFWVVMCAFKWICMPAPSFIGHYFTHQRVVIDLLSELYWWVWCVLAIEDCVSHWASTVRSCWLRANIVLISFKANSKCVYFIQDKQLWGSLASFCCFFSCLSLCAVNWSTCVHWDWSVNVLHTKFIFAEDVSIGFVVASKSPILWKS